MNEDHRIVQEQVPSATNLRPFERYFDVIDTEAKAYWLGFIVADGCILWNETTGNYALQVVLQTEDEDHLLTLEHDMGGSRAPMVVSTQLDGYGEYKAVKLTWYSKYLVLRLMDIGVRPRKSGNETFPTIPEQFSQHFWRGIFDGDGCLVTQSKGSNLVLEYRFSLAGSCALLEAFQDWAQATVNVRPQKVVKAKNSQGEAKISVFYMNGNRQIAALMTALYHDSTRRLLRKYNTYSSLLEQNARTQPSFRRVYQS